MSSFSVKEKVLIEELSEMGIRMAFESYHWEVDKLVQKLDELSAVSERMDVRNIAEMALVYFKKAKSYKKAELKNRQMALGVGEVSRLKYCI